MPEHIESVHTQEEVAAVVCKDLGEGSAVVGQGELMRLSYHMVTHQKEMMRLLGQTVTHQNWKLCKPLHRILDSRTLH
jgi:hypothetical protein